MFRFPGIVIQQKKEREIEWKFFKLNWIENMTNKQKRQCWMQAIFYSNESIWFCIDCIQSIVWSCMCVWLWFKFQKIHWPLGFISSFTLFKKFFYFSKKREMKKTMMMTHTAWCLDDGKKIFVCLSFVFLLIAFHKGSFFCLCQSTNIDHNKKTWPFCSYRFFCCCFSCH